jgi:hypothetical protein
MKNNKERLFELMANLNESFRPIRWIGTHRAGDNAAIDYEMADYKKQLKVKKKISNDEFIVETPWNEIIVKVLGFNNEEEKTIN